MSEASDTARRHSATDALGLETDEMRRLGYWVVDRVVEHFEQNGDGPAIRIGSAEDLRGALGGPVPQTPGDPLEAMQTLVDVALANMQHGDHPRYFARVPGASSYAGVLGEWLGTGFNVIAASWEGSTGPTTVELIALDWLRQLLGLPDGTEGILLSGGSLSSLTGIAAARHELGPGVAYLTDQTHASIRRGLITLGFAADEIHVVKTDERLRMTADAVREAIAGDRREGASPASSSPPPARPIPARSTTYRVSRSWRRRRAPGCMSTVPTARPGRCAPPAVPCWRASSWPTRSCSTPTSGCFSRLSRVACS